MDGSTHVSDADRELHELRARAYGPGPGIDGDQDALARLRELEAAHRAGLGSRAADQAEPTAGGSTSSAPSMPAGAVRTLWLRAMATRRSRLIWGAGAVVMAIAVVATLLFVFAPRPDATLHPTEAPADDQVRRLISEDRSLEIDPSSLRAYGSYLGLEIWAGVNPYDSPCLVAVIRASDILSEGRCAPSSAELMLDVSSDGDDYGGLPGDGIVRFILRDDTVDAYVHLIPGSG